MELTKIINDGENTKVEFKESISDPAFETISAFSNTEGGLLLGGVADDGSIVGVECVDRFVNRNADKIADTMGIHPSINCCEKNGKKIIVIKVEKSTLPIAYKGRYYKRVGTTTRTMLSDELKEFFLKDSFWDSLTNDFEIDEIDEGTIKKYLKMALGSGRLGLADPSDTIAETLEKLNLIVDGKITNAAIILFGKDPQKYFSNAMIRVAKIKNDNMISDRRIEGNLFEQVEGAQEAIKNAINVRYEIKGNLTRTSIWDYPLDAIREALLNSVIHRNYFRHNIQTQIKIYEDYIWFFNTGGLYGGMTIENLKNPHPSTSRNPLISNVLYRAGLVEVYGTGIKRIMNSLRDSRLLEPEFKEEYGGFSLYMRKSLDIYYKKLGLTGRQIKAMNYVNLNNKITVKDFSQIVTEVKERTLRNDLNNLVKKGLLKKIGETKGRYYERISEET